jgi:hypothetical protein
MEREGPFFAVAPLVFDLTFLANFPPNLVRGGVFVPKKNVDPVFLFGFCIGWFLCG